MSKEVKINFNSTYFGEFSQIFNVSNSDELHLKIYDFLYTYMRDNFDNIVDYLVDECDYSETFEDEV